MAWFDAFVELVSAIVSLWKEDAALTWLLKWIQIF